MAEHLTIKVRITGVGRVKLRLAFLLIGLAAWLFMRACDLFSSVGDHVEVVRD